uniref:Putative secreted protein n=1 Tax=Amblyomma americanum TaxID=6943 RepID=A0A0C9SDB2_AMBAM
MLAAPNRVHALFNFCFAFSHCMLTVSWATGVPCLVCEQCSCECCVMYDEAASSLLSSKSPRKVHMQGIYCHLLAAQRCWFRRGYWWAAPYRRKCKDGPLMGHHTEGLEFRKSLPQRKH